MPFGTSKGPTFLGSFSRVTSAARDDGARRGAAGAHDDAGALVDDVACLEAGVADRLVHGDVVPADARLHEAARLARDHAAPSRCCGAPCTWQRKPSSAYFSARTMPDLASRRDASTSWVLFPIEETMPMPVTTTRLIAESSPRLVVPLALRHAAEASSRAIEHRSRRRRLLARFEQADAQVGGRRSPGRRPS